MKVKFNKITATNPQSLAIVKSIIEHTGNGLKASKDIYDGFRWYDKETILEISDDLASGCFHKKS